MENDRPTLVEWLIALVIVTALVAIGLSIFKPPPDRSKIPILDPTEVNQVK